MSYGFALLPTADNPTSTMTLRLSPSEKRERDEWILGAVEHGLKISEIAFEVGLSEQRVKQIIREKTSVKKTRPGRQKKFKTPRDAAMDDFYNNQMCRSCVREGFPWCPDCIGRSFITENEYDANGWPYDWAMYGQEKYIAMCT